ncbi:MAG: recombination mediator RecR [Fusobacteriota bacterium]
MGTKSLSKLTDEFRKLPGIGEKTAQRLSFYVMEMSKEEVKSFADAMIEVKNKITKCEVCGNLSESKTCNICEDNNRDNKLVCVVEGPKDVIAMERGGRYKGKYHVLHGKIDPLNGIDVEDLNIKSLLHRIEKEDIEEIILALNPDLEGETTGMYLTKLLKNFDIKISKIASGIPMGGNIEFSDMATLSRSIEDRREVDKD